MHKEDVEGYQELYLRVLAATKLTEAEKNKVK
jgi:hypothetical protein